MKTVYFARLLIEKDGCIDRRAIIKKLESGEPLNGAEGLFLAETLTRLWLPKNELRAAQRQYRLARIEQHLQVVKLWTKERRNGQSALEIVRKKHRFASVNALKRWLNKHRRAKDKSPLYHYFPFGK